MSTFKQIVRPSNELLVSFLIPAGWNTWNDAKLADEFLQVCGAGGATANKIITEHPVPEGLTLKLEVGCYLHQGEGAAASRLDS